MALLSHWHQGNMVPTPGPTCCRDANWQYGRRKLAVWETQTGSMGDANWQYGRRKLAVWGFQQGNLVHPRPSQQPAAGKAAGRILPTSTLNLRHVSVKVSIWQVEEL